MSSELLPPIGYATWLDFALERIGIYGIRLEPPAFDEEADREAALGAIYDELRTLRADAGRPDTGPHTPIAVPTGFVTERPIELLSIREFALAIGEDSEDSVRLRLRDGALIAVTLADKSGLPSFQVWEGIAGRPLATALAPFRGDGTMEMRGTEAYGFLTGVSDLLLYLAPLELLLGCLLSARRISNATRNLLGPVNTNASRRQ